MELHVRYDQASIDASKGKLSLLFCFSYFYWSCNPHLQAINEWVFQHESLQSLLLTQDQWLLLEQVCSILEVHW
jgi:hypothetical protein